MKVEKNHKLPPKSFTSMGLLASAVLLACYLSQSYDSIFFTFSSRMLTRCRLTKLLRVLNC